MNWTLIVASSLLMVAVSVFMGFKAGCFYDTYTSNQYLAGQSRRHKALDSRTNAHEPSCEALRQTGIPGLVKKGNDYYFVHVETDYFHVMGINFMPGKPPAMTWWGGGRKAALEGCP